MCSNLSFQDIFSLEKSLSFTARLYFWIRIDTTQTFNLTILFFSFDLAILCHCQCCQPQCPSLLSEIWDVYSDIIVLTAGDNFSPSSKYLCGAVSHWHHSPLMIMFNWISHYFYVHCRQNCLRRRVLHNSSSVLTDKELNWTGNATFMVMYSLYLTLRLLCLDQQARHHHLLFSHHHNLMNHFSSYD